MSRSYRKYPIAIYEKGEPKQGNRYIRHNINVELPPKGNAYKKTGKNGWVAKHRYSLEEALIDYYALGLDKRWILEEYIIDYKRDCIWK